MTIIWTPEAAQDSADIWDYLHSLNPIAALDMDNRFKDVISRISRFPESGPFRYSRVNPPSKLSLGLPARI
ncbi:type II toxin-antitoxin system RelE/ParE family toxin [Pseudomonas migulae]|uniref:type II toxin-antitoxin system RelE/ParE family toxin n=1 Tax=Pseudomonas migulae TaxID=78543 RepID=UPI003F59D74C